MAAVERTAAVAQATAAAEAKIVAVESKSLAVAEAAALRRRREEMEQRDLPLERDTVFPFRFAVRFLGFRGVARAAVRYGEGSS